MKAEQQASSLVEGWSLKEKVGQLFILAFPGKDASIAESMIADYNLGGCYLSQDNAETFDDAHTLTKALDSLTDRYHRLPLLNGVDQEGAWGVLVGESTTGPGNLSLGVRDDANGTCEMYALMAEEMRHAGFNCILGPCCDVNANPLSPIIDTRSFGDQPQKVAMHAAGAVKGLTKGGIVSCAKHFPGHGDTQGDTHRDIPVVDKSYAELKDNDLAPFQSAINAGVDLIMTSHIRYPQLDAESPATLSSTILNKVLRQDMGFDGIIISDSMNMGAIVNHYDPSDAAVKAMRAGITMIMLSEEHYDHSDSYLDKQFAMIHGVIDAVTRGELDESIIDEAVLRVVRFKLSKLVSMERFQTIDITSNQKHAGEIAANGVTWVRDQPDLAGKPLYVINATPQTSYHNLMNPRGIGPNQRDSAFSYFQAALNINKSGVREITAEQAALAKDGWLVVVTENHPLPGEDFDQVKAKQTIEALSRDFSNLIVVGLRSPYDLMQYPDVKFYLCAHSPRPEAAVAAAEVLTGKRKVSAGTAVAKVQ